MKDRFWFIKELSNNTSPQLKLKVKKWFDNIDKQYNLVRRLKKTNNK